MGLKIAMLYFCKLNVKQQKICFIHGKFLIVFNKIGSEVVVLKYVVEKELSAVHYIGASTFTSKVA